MEIHSSKIDIEYTSPVTIYTYNYTDQEDLDYLIKKTMNNIGAMDYKTNVLGKMTDYQYFNKNKIFLKVLFKVLSDAKYHVKTLSNQKELLVSEAWGAILHKGDYVKLHDHSVCSLVGVLYLSDGENLNFYKSYEQKPENVIYSVKPKKGTVVLFPSWCFHGTEQNKSDTPRICLPFNLYFFPYTKYKKLKYSRKL